MALGIESPGPQCAFETSMFMCPAVHTTTRILLRPSSTHEPSDPPFRVVCSLYHNIYRNWRGGVWRTGGRFRRCMTTSPSPPQWGATSTTRAHGPRPRTPPGSAAPEPARAVRGAPFPRRLFITHTLDCFPFCLVFRNSHRFSRRAARADDRADAYRPTLGRAPLECRYAATAFVSPGRRRVRDAADRPRGYLGSTGGRTREGVLLPLASVGR